MGNKLLNNNIHQLMSLHRYKEAAEAIELLLDEGGHDPENLLSLARCQLACDRLEDAAASYGHLLEHIGEFDPVILFEAALVLHQSEQTAPLFASAFDTSKEHPEFLFLAAIFFYQQGKIKRSAENLSRAIQLDFEWEDEDPIDYVAQQILPAREFHDFEQIYLDCFEQVRENADKPQNRWFSLNMLIWDLLKASTLERQQGRAQQLAGLLSLHFDENFLSGGKSELWRIINDMNKNAQNEAFVDKARETIRDGKYAETARLVLSLELDHLGQFASFFGLTLNEVNESNLQSLLVLLPLRLAVGLIFLYSVSHTDEKLSSYDVVKLPDDIFAGLIAACFVSFYQQVDAFRPMETNN